MWKRRKKNRNRTLFSEGDKYFAFLEFIIGIEMIFAASSFDEAVFYHPINTKI